MKTIRSFGLTAAVLCTIVAFQARAQTQIYTLGVEDPVDGFVGTIPGTLIRVACDGEAPLLPFGITVDVSDAISFDAQVNAGLTWDIDPSVTGWTLNPGTYTWYIDAASVPENQGEGEQLGIWHSPAPWVAGVIGQYNVLEADGSLSDVIMLYNDQNGAVLTFNSVPEPGMIALSAVALLSAVGVRVRARLTRKNA